VLRCLIALNPLEIAPVGDREQGQTAYRHRRPRPTARAALRHRARDRARHGGYAASPAGEAAGGRQEVVQAALGASAQRDPPKAMLALQVIAANAASVDACRLTLEPGAPPRRQRATEATRWSIWPRDGARHVHDQASNQVV
jgi:hypothetical protein